VEVELAGDLVGSAVVGDVVTVWGQCKVLATNDSLGVCGCSLGTGACGLAWGGGVG
jgi:hypothetical protein